ncbi:MAG TPA: tetratricopeptide repeat protein [Vicinamibacteria bacterium]|nr:tetratricopeptide repeat protein [Vicinamibacteria bacterium]
MATPRAPFDQGLFLAHFNKGKDHFDAKHYEEAERQLEEAYLLRPRDQKVLNLLGLVYFKQEKFEKAEEIYRKLAAESPDAPTLYYNLGLIYFKLQRLEEAEPAFIKALELSGSNPKINFYLGSIYERLKRYQDAIFQYRQAGANLLVRRVEDKLAGRARSTPPPPPPDAEPLTIPPRAAPRLVTPPDPAGDAFPPPLAAAAQPPPKSAADTAEFKAAEIREALRKEHASRMAAENEAFPPRDVSPLSPNLLAGPGRERHPEIISFPQRSSERTQPVSTDRTLPPTRRPEIFRFLDNNLMEIDFSGKVFIKQGTIYSYGGNLTFWVKERRPGGHAPLVMITGTGKVILTDREHEITFMHVQDEVVHVEPSHLLACEATLTPRYVTVGAAPGAPEFLALDGTGMLALSVASKPLALVVTPDMPVSVPASSIITWSGDVVPCAVDDREVYEVMLAGHSPDTLIRLEGSGRLLVEQAHR